MRKGWIVLLAAVTVALVALPVMAANMDATGFIRTKGHVSNYNSYTGSSYISPSASDNNDVTNSFVEERFRLRLQIGDENAKGVIFLENDMLWGDSAYTNGRNTGGALESDTSSIELKNAFVWFKLPNTPLDFTVGMQGVTDSFGGTFLGYADTAGILTNFKFDPVAFRLAWFKFWENNVRFADDVDLYMVEAKFAPVQTVKLGANFYVLNDMSTGTYGPTSAGAAGPIGGRGAAGNWKPAEYAAGYDNFTLYMPGVDFTVQAGPAAISGFAFYQFGTVERPGNPAGDVDVKGYAADVRADLNLGPGKLFVEGLYVSGDDSKTDTDYKSIITASNYNLAGSYYARTDMQILFMNLDDINTSAGLAYDVANGGAGVMHIAGGYTQKLTDTFSFKVGAGYLAATKKRVRDIGPAANFASEKSMGTEVNARINYAIAKGLDFGLQGAYAFLGKAYDNPGNEFDDLYDLQFRLNYAF